MATEYGNRLKAAQAHARLTQKVIASRVGMGQGSLSELMSSGHGSSLTAQIAKVCGVNPHWLATGEGEMLGANYELTAAPGEITLGQIEAKSIAVAPKIKPDELVIPEFNTGGAMGCGLLLRDQPGVIRGWTVNQEWINKNIKSHTSASNLCIVTGFGDSMKGMFNSGDPLVVDRGVTSVEYDAVYFFRVGDEGFIKRLQRIPGDGIRVLSENKKYESWTIKEGMDFEVFGRVLKAWQGENF